MLLLTIIFRRLLIYYVPINSITILIITIVIVSIQSDITVVLIGVILKL